MKIVVISDSHGNIASLKHVMGFAKKIQASAVFHCGDWENYKAVKTVSGYKIPLYSVLGNADIDPKIEDLLKSACKKFDRLFLQMILDSRKIGIIHDIKKLESEVGQLDILFSGHTHLAFEKMTKTVKFVNPGALENGISFVVYDTISDKIEFIHE